MDNKNVIDTHVRKTTLKIEKLRLKIRLKIATIFSKK
jgi:hypothetical protein